MIAGRRPLVLTLHVLSSVGWFGAVGAFFALAVGGLVKVEGAGALSSYVAMDAIARMVIVPACLASLATGVLQSLLTPWGLFRHYWVVFKLGLTVAITGLLFVHLGPIRDAAAMGARAPVDLAALKPLARKLVVTSGGALVVLIVTTVLSVYKPKGTVSTPTASRPRRDRCTDGEDRGSPSCRSSRHGAQRL
jgi:hypothetical protein